jgi:hypothetical protein
MTNLPEWQPKLFEKPYFILNNSNRVAAIKISVFKEKPMIISDLSYLEIVCEEQVEGGFDQGYDYSNIYFNEYFNINKYVNSNTYVKGHLATAESNAYGYGTLTQTFSNTTPYSSNSVSIAATGW